MHSLLEWISRYGYAGLFGLLVLGIVGLPVPDETLLVFCGSLISRGRLHPVLTFGAGFAGSACGMSVSYALGRTLGVEFVHRWGRYVHLTQTQIDRVNHWFHRMGHWLLTFGYYVPGVRHFTAFVAGMSGLEFRTFAAYAFPGAAIWVSSFLLLGYAVGANWESVLRVVHRDLLAITAIGACLSVLVWWFRRRRSGI